MKKIKDLFGRAGLIRPPAESLRLVAQQAIKEIVGLEIKTADLIVRGGTLFVRASPAAKSQIFLMKKELLGSIKKALGPKNLLIEIR